MKSNLINARIRIKSAERCQADRCKTNYKNLVVSPTKRDDKVEFFYNTMPTFRYYLIIESLHLNFPISRQVLNV